MCFFLTWMFQGFTSSTSFKPSTPQQTCSVNLSSVTQNGWHRPLEGQDWILQVQGCTWLCSSSWLWLHDVWQEEVQLQEMWMWLSCLWEWCPLCLWMWKGFWGEPSGQNELCLLWWWKNLWGRPCDQKQLCFCDWEQAGEGWGWDSSWPWTFQPGEYHLNLLCECDST